MQFIRTAIWVILAVALALFAKANWNIAPSYTGRVPVKLIGDAILEVRLPILILAAFLAGLLPMWSIARLSRWRMQRRLHSAEQALAVSAVQPVEAAPATTLVSDAPVANNAATLPDDSTDITADVPPADSTGSAPEPRI